MDGVLNVRKPAGITSFDVIARLRRIYGQKKIGHGGTLDPMAEGVLPVFLGRMTRLIEYAPIHKKTYEAEFVMGYSTDTEDVTGTVTARGPVCEERQVWEKALEKFRGDILQVPSAYSAIHVNGRRAYDLAREGKQVDLPARPVTIYDLTITDFQPPRISLSLTCSSGTYVRALGRDLGQAAGSPLTMAKLLRTRMGAFGIEEARMLEEIAADPEGSLMTDIRPILSALPSLELSSARGADFLQGKRMHTAAPGQSCVAVFSGSKFLGIGEVKAGILHPRKVFN